MTPFRSAVLGIVGGLAMGSVCGCASTQGHEEGQPVTEAPLGDVAVAPVEPGVVVCKLVGRDSIVEVMGSERGTRYTLRDERGVLIAAGLDAAGLAQIRPDLDPRMLQADEPVMGPLMLIDADRVP